MAWEQEYRQELEALTEKYGRKLTDGQVIAALGAAFKAALATSGNPSDEWTEGQFEALITLHMLKPGEVLTEDDCWAIEHVRVQADEVENSAIDAFDNGRKHGIVSVAGKTDAQMFAEIERLKTELTVSKALSRFYQRSCSTEFIRGASACREVMARFVEQGGDPATANSIRLNWSPTWGEEPKNAPPLSGCEGHGTEQSQAVEAVPGMNSTNKADQ